MKRIVRSAWGRAVVAVLAASSASACVSGSSHLPDWYKAKEAGLRHGYPRLEDVPQTTSAITDTRHWDAVQQDVDTAAAALHANPRDAVAPPTDPNAFESQARGEIDRTRATHGEEAAPAVGPAAH